MNTIANKVEKYKDYDLSNLTPRQIEVFQLALAGISCSKIAKELGTSKQNISGIIQFAINTLESAENKTPKTSNARVKHFAKKRNCFDYSQLVTRDLSLLSSREQEVLILAASNKTYGEISEELAISISSVGVLLNRAKLKLTGEYEPKRELAAQKERERKAHMDETKKEKIREYAKEYHKKYYQGNNDKISAYNKEYYQKNRERILAKKKVREKSE